MAWRRDLEGTQGVTAEHFGEGSLLLGAGAILVSPS